MSKKISTKIIKLASTKSSLNASQRKFLRNSPDLKEDTSEMKVAKMLLFNNLDDKEYQLKLLSALHENLNRVSLTLPIN